jgi:hypothetical protein
MLERELGDARYSKATISQWETGKHCPSVKQLVAVSKLMAQGLPFELATLGGGAAENHGDMDSAPRFPAQRIQVHAGPPPGTVAVRRMNVRLQAGVAKLDPDYDETFGEDVSIPIDVIQQLKLDPQNLRAFQVKGRSGEPMFFEDDLVVVDVTHTKPINRELYAIAFDGEACIKQMLHRGGQWYLHSINPEFGPINIKSGELKIVGRVVYQPGRVVTGRL